MIKYDSRRSRRGIRYYNRTNRKYVLRFDGVNDYIEHPIINATKVCTWSCDFKLNSVSGLKVLFGRGDSNYMLGIFNGTININYFGTFYQSPAIITANTPTTITITRNNNEHKIYINGVLYATTNIITALDTEFLWLGATFSGGMLGFLQGTLKNAKIFNRALSGAEVLSLYNGTIPSGCIFDFRPIYPTHITTLNPTIPFNAVTGQPCSIFGKTNPMSLLTDFEPL